MTKKKVFWLVIIFILYEVLVWGFSLTVLPDNAVLIGSVLTICGLTLLGVYILVSRLAGRTAHPVAAPGPPAQAPQPQAPPPPPGPSAAPPEEAQAMAALISEANARLAQSPRLASQRARSTIADFPVYLIAGSEGSGKTSLFLASGLDIESLAGQVQRDSTVVPTRFANIWFAGNSIVVEAGSQISGDPGRWSRFLGLFGPQRSRSAMTKVFAADGRSNVRAVVFCVDTSPFCPPNGIPDASRLSAMAQRAQQQLRKVAETLGGDFPVYVVFTKADGIPFFADYFARITDAEDQQICGCTLAPAALAQFGSSDQYTSSETARLTHALNNLYVSLADKRLRFLERETDRNKKPAIYEFPREVRRVRAPLVQFLVDVFRPNPLQPNPSLRGFYFTGTRRVAVPGAAEQSTYQTGIYRVGDATRIFRAEDFRMQPEMPASTGQEQLITRWSFAGDLWRSLLRSGAAIAPVAVNRAQEQLRKLIFGCAAAFFLLLFLLFTVSFFRNRSLLADVQAAADNCEIPAARTVPSLKQLQGIDHLREELALLVDYDDSHPPLTMRWGLYSAGGRVLDTARHFYFTRFREYFLNDIVQRMETSLGGLPPSQTDAHPVPQVFGDLKIYRTVTKSPEERCPPDNGLAKDLLDRWRGDRTLDGESEKLALANFEFFADSLERNKIPQELMIVSKDREAVQRARDYLNASTGIETLYHTIIEQANQQIQSTARLDSLTTKYRATLQVADRVDSAFTLKGWDAVQKLIDDAAEGRSRSSCVLGKKSAGAKATELLTGSGPDSDLKRQLREMYIKDYVRRWTEFVSKADTLPYSNCGDAAKKLDLLAGADSPMLAVLLLTAENTVFPKTQASLADDLRKDAADSAKRKILGFNLPGASTKKAFQQKLDQATTDTAPVLTRDFITQTFQPAWAVFDGKPNRERWLNQQNSGYVKALAELQHAMETLGPNGECNLTDQAAFTAARGQVQKSKDSVAALVGNFDLTAMYDPVKKFLESPIRSTEKLLPPDGGLKQKLNVSQADLCKKVSALGRRYPFNREAGDDVTLDDLNRVFAPQGGALGVVRQLLGDNLVQNGSVWESKPDAPVKLSSTFLSFFNRMWPITVALYPTQSAQPSMHYKLRILPNKGVKEVTGTVGGEPISMAEKEYSWPTQNPRIDLQYIQTADKANMGAYEGNWAIFQLLSEADKPHFPAPNDFGLVKNQTGRHSKGQNLLPDGSAITLEVTAFPNGVQRAFDKDFFRIGTCPGKATED